eukprot:09200_5
MCFSHVLLNCANVSSSSNTLWRSTATSRSHFKSPSSYSASQAGSCTRETFVIYISCSCAWTSLHFCMRRLSCAFVYPLV